MTFLDLEKAFDTSAEGGGLVGSKEGWFFFMLIAPFRQEVLREKHPR